MRHLPTQVSELTVRQAFERRNWISRFLHRPPPLHRKHPRLPRLECIWFPYFIAAIQLSMSTHAPGETVVSVEGWSGAFAFFELEHALVEGQPPGPHFEPNLALPEVLEIARSELLHAVLRQANRGEKPLPGEVLRGEWVYFPLWIWYEQRHSGRIEIRVREGINGQPIGVRTRNGVLDAFLKAHAES
jgi:hypothetical protein